MDTQIVPWLPTWGALAWESTVWWCFKTNFLYFIPSFNPFKIAFNFRYNHRPLTDSIFYTALTAKVRPIPPLSCLCKLGKLNLNYTPGIKSKKI